MFKKLFGKGKETKEKIKEDVQEVTEAAQTIEETRQVEA